MDVVYSELRVPIRRYDWLTIRYFCFIWKALIVNNDGVCNSSLAVSDEYTGEQDAVRKPLLVEPEGASREYTVGEYLCTQSG